MGLANQRCLQRYDLTVAQLVGLFALSPAKGVRIGDYARTLELDAGAATRSVERLVARGLAEKRPDKDDRRATRVHLTRKGRQKMNAARDGLAEANAQLTAGFSDEEIATVARFLEQAAELG